MPSQKDIDHMRHQIESSMKNFTPQMQQEMEKLKKQMEQQKLDLQQMMQDFSSGASSSKADRSDLEKRVRP